jgi:hypothetical protein
MFSRFIFYLIMLYISTAVFYDFSIPKFEKIDIIKSDIKKNIKILFDKYKKCKYYGLDLDIKNTKILPDIIVPLNFDKKNKIKQNNYNYIEMSALEILFLVM